MIAPRGEARGLAGRAGDVECSAEAVGRSTRYGEITGGCHSGSLHTAPSAASSGLFDILSVFYHSFTPVLVCCHGNS